MNESGRYYMYIHVKTEFLARPWLNSRLASWPYHAVAATISKLKLNFSPVRKPRSTIIPNSYISSHWMKCMDARACVYMSVYDVTITIRNTYTDPESCHRPTCGTTISSNVRGNVRTTSVLEESLVG